MAGRLSEVRRKKKELRRANVHAKSRIVHGPRLTFRDLLIPYIQVRAFAIISDETID
jgi:hypothetical protein